MSNTEKKTPDLIAYQVTEGKETSFWNRIGATWKNKKGGYQVKLTSFPVNGELVLLPRKEED